MYGRVAVKVESAGSKSSRLTTLEQSGGLGSLRIILEVWFAIRGENVDRAIRRIGEVGRHEGNAVIENADAALQ